MLKQRQPSTSGSRHHVSVDKTGLHKGDPEKSLVAKGHLKRQGRGYKGRITMRHRGGGVKKQLRIIDWKRNKTDVPGRVEHLEYDPMRSANIALIFYVDGDKRYIVAPDDLKVGDEVVAGPKAEVKPGNAMPLKRIPIGIPIHNLEMRAGKGAQLVRGAGTAAYIQSKEEKYVTVQLPSKELRLINAECYATIGQVGNVEWKNRSLGKAGRKRLLGIRPTVRGVAQHPGSHPHGGGEGRSGVGLKQPKTPWGKPARGLKTRGKKKSSKFIVRDRRMKA
jgi:large subunit ribosomal protein L2